MGMVSTAVRFVGRAPDLLAIAASAEEVCGLALSVAESGPEIKASLYDLHGQLAFARAPEEAVEAFAYRPGAVRAFVEETFGEVQHGVGRFVQGLHEPEGTQCVYLRGPLGAEPTLLAVVILALEALGGQPAEPLDEEERRKYGRRIPEEELLARRKEARRGAWLALLAVVSLLPLLLPLWLLYFTLVIVITPLRVGRAYRIYREVERERAREGGGDRSPPRIE